MNHVLTRLLVARLLQIVALSSIFVGLITHRLLADLTLVSTVNVIGMPLDPGHSDNFQFPLTITTFFQGEKARMEVSDGRVYIFDNEKDTVYQLDTKFDTFRTGSIKNLLDFKSSVPKEQQTNISVSSDLSTGDPLDSDTFLTLETKSISLAGDAHISIRVIRSNERNTRRTTCSAKFGFHQQISCHERSTQLSCLSPYKLCGAVPRSSATYRDDWIISTSSRCILRSQ